MADGPQVTGAAREWLTARRDDLNARYRAARRRYSKLDAQAVLNLSAELLPPLAGAGEAGSDALLSSVFDLILLHAGRGMLSLAPSPMRILLSETAPKMRGVLLQRARTLSELSNAVEHLRKRGGEFARTLSAMASQFQTPEQVRAAGLLLAWRLGEARLREQALGSASQLPNSVVLFALGLEGWPESTAPLALASLIGDAWCHPRERFRPQTLLNLSSAPRAKVLAVLEKLNAPVGAYPAAGKLSATCGEFAGFGGRFLEPPKLLYVGKNTQRHRFWVRSGTENFRIDADIFGWVCRPDPEADYPVQETIQLSATRAGSTSVSGKVVLYSDGELIADGKRERFDDLRDASSYCVVSDLLAATGRDSFRIRIYSPARPAL